MLFLGSLLPLKRSFAVLGRLMGLGKGLDSSINLGVDGQDCEGSQVVASF